MQDKDTRFSAKGGLVLLGNWFCKAGVWDQVEQQVPIRQKSIKHTPHEKLLDAFIHILSGAERMVTLNTGLRCDEAVQRAFGRKRCADQSLVSTTLDRCDEQSVAGLRLVLKQCLTQYGAVSRHRFKDGKLLLDVDTTGILAGQQAEGSEKGFFSAKKGGVVAKSVASLQPTRQNS